MVEECIIRNDGSIDDEQCCSVCMKVDSYSPLTHFDISLCAIIGAGFKKEKMGLAVLSGNYLVECVFKPIAKLELHFCYCNDCRKAWESELSKQAKDSKAAIRIYAKVALVSLMVFIISLFLTKISSLIFGIVAAFSGLVFFLFLFLSWDSKAEFKEQSSEKGIDSHIEKTLMKTQQSITKLVSIQSSIDLSKIKYPISFLGQASEKGLLFIPIKDPWYADFFAPGWYSLGENPSGYAVTGWDAKYEKIVVTNANFGNVPGGLKLVVIEDHQANSNE